MRRFVAAVVFSLALGAPASAAPGALEAAVNTDSYLVETVTMPQGSELLFANLDVLNAHSITATDFVNGEPIFHSGSVEPRTTKTMTDLAALPAGEYGFYCSIHHSMTGTLQIT